MTTASPSLVQAVIAAPRLGMVALTDSGADSAWMIARTAGLRTIIVHVAHAITDRALNAMFNGSEQSLQMLSLSGKVAFPGVAIASSDQLHRLRIAELRVTSLNASELLRRLVSIHTLILGPHTSVVDIVDWGERAPLLRLTCSVEALIRLKNIRARDLTLLECNKPLPPLRVADLRASLRRLHPHVLTITGWGTTSGTAALRNDLPSVTHYSLILLGEDCEVGKTLVSVYSTPLIIAIRMLTTSAQLWWMSHGFGPSIRTLTIHLTENPVDLLRLEGVVGTLRCMFGAQRPLTLNICLFTSLDSVTRSYQHVL